MFNKKFLDEEVSFLSAGCLTVAWGMSQGRIRTSLQVTYINYSSNPTIMKLNCQIASQKIMCRLQTVF